MLDASAAALAQISSDIPTHDTAPRYNILFAYFLPPCPRSPNLAIAAHSIGLWATQFE